MNSISLAVTVSIPDLAKAKTGAWKIEPRKANYESKEGLGASHVVAELSTAELEQAVHDPGRCGVAERFSAGVPGSGFGIPSPTRPQLD